MATVLKKRQSYNKKEVAYIGILIPKEVASFLSIYSVANGITKTKVINDLLIKWKEETLATKSEFEYVKQIVELSWESWKNYPIKRTTFYAFCYKLRTEFKARGLKPELINLILDKLKYEKEESER
jgi:hypothetical protein